MSIDIKSGIQLSRGNADAWTHHKLVIGSLENPEACETVWIDNGATRVQAVMDGSSFSASVPIHAETNTLKAVCQHTDQEDELSPEVTFTGRLQQRPKAMIASSISNGYIILDGTGSLPDELEQRPVREYFWSARTGNPATVNGSTDEGQGKQELKGEISGPSLTVEVPPVDGEYYFSLRVIDEAGREDTSSTYFVVEQGKPRIPDFDHENPAWVEEAIVYGVIPRLFGSPGAEAIQYKLDDLADLGITALWLAPINATIDYGYSVIDYFELRDSFGPKEDFHALIQAAHERGIRVLMDFVPNHTSNEHPYFMDTLEKGEASPYWDFYDRDESGDYTYYFDWTHLPNLNYDNPQVRRMMIEAFSYWVREFDVDGFRVDACWGVQERRPDFWPEWRRQLKRIKPDLLLLAEASARDSYNFDNGFDAAYDWTENLGQWAWGRFWGDEASETDTDTTIELLKEALTNPPEGYHPDALVFRFLNNNDTRTRFIATHGEGLTRVATALLLTLAGIPCVYTADELGQSFLPYDSGLISWRERYRGLRDYHKKLIALRKEIPSLHSRLWQLLEVGPADKILAYIRYLEGNEEPVLVLLNFSEEPAAVQLSLPEEFSSLIEAGSLSDRLNDEDIAFNGTNAIQMNSMSARILMMKKE
ncbi:MAG TPA: alpha-amylase family glycosyl hydrolase [Anaerolineales bacterium]|nr:alpha-amylase family glycosyl hydrolase [Anaerolineales bacterium]